MYRTRVIPPYPPQRFQRVDDLRQAFFPGAFAGEAGSEFGFGEGGGGIGEDAGDGGDLFGQGGRPGLAGGSGSANRRGGAGFVGCAGAGFGQAGLLRGAGGVLVFGAQPADVAFRFFRRALGVQGHQPDEQGFGGGFPRCRVGRSQQWGEVAPAVGSEHGGVEFVVQGFQHTDQALFVDGFFLGRQCFAGLKLFQYVV